MITEAQRRERAHYVGSSDVPVLYGVDPWRTLRDLYWSKVAPEAADGRRGGAAVEIGNIFERPLLDYAARRLDVEIVPGAEARRGHDITHLDARVADRPEAIEAKVTSVLDEWGEEGTDQVPDRVIVQAMHQMAVAELERVWVVLLAVRFGGELRLYRVERDDEMIRDVLDRSREFWSSVTARRPPDGSTIAPLDVARRLPRHRRAVALRGAGPQAAVARHRAVSALAKHIKSRRDEASAELIAALGDADEARLDDGTRITLYEQDSPPACDWSLLAARWPDAYQRCVSRGRHRVLRIHPPPTKELPHG